QNSSGTTRMMFSKWHAPGKNCQQSTRLLAARCDRPLPAEFWNEGTSVSLAWRARSFFDARRPEFVTADRALSFSSDWGYWKKTLRACRFRRACFVA
ncbi:MAG TPA: hypothetical protein VGC79_12315, partial [Polyangiaceae bacterium]